MDMKKIGIFIKQLRKEKGLTQEQLAEVLGIAGRTVSRWETASNMPDLSMIIQIAEFFDVEVKEILNGEKNGEKMNQELKETLEKVADYNKAEKEIRLKIFVTTFLTTIIVGIITVNIQLLMFLDIRYILGEAIILLAGSITAIFMTVKNGLWGKSNNKLTTKNDVIISGIMAVLFSCVATFFIYKSTKNIQTAIIFGVGFFFIIYIIGFVLLRTLAFLSKKRKNKTNNIKK